MQNNTHTNNNATQTATKTYRATIDITIPENMSPQSWLYEMAKLAGNEYELGMDICDIEDDIATF